MLTLNKRQLCDLELILNGGFSPLTGFMNESDYLSCVKNMTLTDGTIWPIPIVLSTDNTFNIGDEIILKDETGISIANMVIESIYKPNLEEECAYVLGSNDPNHPYHAIIMENANKYYIGGTITKICLPLHYDFVDLRLTPTETKQFFKDNNWDTIIGFQTRNLLHRSHFELIKFALNEVGNSAKLLLHPVVGVTQSCDIDYYSRVHCYKKLLEYYPDNTVKLALLPLSMRMAGPREAVLHAIIKRNYGCTHFIVGRDHAGPSYKKTDDKPFYDPYDAHTLLLEKEKDIGIKIILSPSIVYVKELNEYMRENEVTKDMTIMNISGTQQRDMLTNNIEIPKWFRLPPIINEVQNEFPLLNDKGLCIYLVGLSRSGKSTIANILIEKLKELNTGKKITLLDEDVVRLKLSKGLDFSKNNCNSKIRRIGYIASKIVKHGDIVICTNITPYEADRLANRNLISQYGQYFEVYIRTSLECCIRRTVKELYKISIEETEKNFTNISNQFEEPNNADIILDGDENNTNINYNISRIIKKLYNMEVKLINTDFVFYHIEKCGGTTLRHILYNYFNKIYNNNEIFFPDNNNCVYNTIDELYHNYYNINDYKILLAHLSYCANYDVKIKSKFNFTCVRNPIDRFFSHYYHFDYDKTNVHLKDLDDNTLNKHILEYGNLLVTRLSGETRIYEDAVKNVDTLDYIIVLENYNSEIKILNEKLNKYFNVNHTFEYIHMNENKINYKEYMNETIINKIKNYIMDDIKLYNYILSKKK